jgi:hypothetical protein
MARTPKYNEPTKPLSLRPRPSSADQLKAIVEATGRTRAEIADEVLALGFPVWLKRNPINKPKAQAA